MIGRSQMAVLTWMKGRGSVSSEQIGEALYDSTSACAGWETSTPRSQVVQSWARRLLGKLEKKGLVQRVAHTSPLQFRITKD